MTDKIPYYLKNVPTFKHLSDPHAYHRYKDIERIPAVGDFVVCSIDPVASVAHLDELARQAACKLRPQRYIAFVMEMHGLSIGNEPVNAQGFTFVRQGPPRATRPGQPVFRDYCIPILPNTKHPTGRKPLKPAQPLPWQDCYIDTSPDFNFTEVRVSAAPRDYTCVLPCGREEILDTMEMMATDGVLLERRLASIGRGALDAIASLALPPSPTSAFKVPLPPSPVTEEIELPEDTALVERCTSSGLFMSNPAEDDVSIIASDDAESIPDDNQSAHDPGFDIGLLLHLETMFDTSGDVNDPVVNVWYDLDMVKEVLDPIHFLEERAQIRQ
ncbi:hypothetical protein PENSPDRAFT_725887 [Peniophora sp. CONT]|nr:hypothetical protein PENSPDRAFT_725887 [Peniophora sp. CONT]